MSNNGGRRAAACGGAIAIALGVGCIVAPSAQALVPTVTTTVPSVVPSVVATVPSVLPGVIAPVTGTVDGVLQDLTGSGSGSGASGSSGGGLSVDVGRDGSGGSLVSVGLGGSQTGSVGAPGVPGAAGVSGTVSTGSDGGASSGAQSGGSSAGAEVLGLTVRRSVSTVYPVKDGYRDTVSFTLAGLTADGAGAQRLQGVAVLKHGTTEVERWTVTSSDQVLEWNGRTGSRIRTGTYTLAIAATDATGHAVSATSTVKVSAKRLVAATTRLSTLSVSGKHTMAAAPRAGLAKGRVTVRVTTVATKVVGKQRLVFEKDGKRLVVPIRKGTHTSRAISIPASFTTFTTKHSWKKGQVKLKAMRYTYSYQSLR